MKSLSRGAATLALVSMLVQISTGGIPAAWAQSQQLPAIQLQMPQSLYPYRSAQGGQGGPLDAVKLLYQNQMRECEKIQGAGLRAKGFVDDVIQGTKAVSAATKSEESRYRKGNATKSTLAKGTEASKTSPAISCFDRDFKWDLITKDRTKFCSAACARPACVDEISCSAFFPDGAATPMAKSEGKNKISDCQINFGKYERYQKAHAESCLDLESSRVKIEMAFLECQSKAVNAAAQSAQNILNNIGSMNQRMIGAVDADMKSAQGSVTAQLSEMDQLLGLPPDHPVSGLGKVLQDLKSPEYQKMVEALAEAPAKNEGLKLKKKAVDNEVRAYRNKEFSGCLAGSSAVSGSGVRTELCFDEKVPGQKRDCGPLEYLGEVVAQQSLLTGNSNVLDTTTRRSKKQDIRKLFKALQDSIKVQLETPSSKSKTVDDLLADNEQSIKDLLRMSGYGELRRSLRSSLAKCSNFAETRRVEMVKSESVQQKLNEEVENPRNKLNSELDQSIDQMRASYNDAVQALGLTRVPPLATETCSKDTDERVRCAQNLRDQLQKMKAGSYLSATPAGGGSAPGVKIPQRGNIGGFFVPCVGLEACFNALRNARQRHASNLGQAIAQSMERRNQLVKNSNNDLTSAVQDLAGFLKGELRGFGESGPVTFLEGEALEFKEGELASPKNTLKLVSGFMSPGLPSYDKTAADKLVAEAKGRDSEKKKGAIESLGADKDLAKGLVDLLKDCIALDDPNSKDNVGSGACDAFQCRQDLKACKENGALSAILEALGGIAANRGKSDAIQSKFNTALNDLEGLACVDEAVKRRCSACIESKKDTWTTNQTTVDSSAEKAGTQD